MHAFTSFPLVEIPHYPHLCNWTADDFFSQTVGPQTVAEVSEQLRQEEGDKRVVDAGWDTMGWYWDNLSRPTNRTSLRTASYPGIDKSIFAWKDNSRPPTAIDIALNARIDSSQFRPPETPRGRDANPEPARNPPVPGTPAEPF